MSKKETPRESLRLSEVPLLRTLPAEEIDRLFETHKIWDAPVGALILREGEPSDDFHVILQGQVEILRALGSADKE